MLPHALGIGLSVALLGMLLALEFGKLSRQKRSVTTLGKRARKQASRKLTTIKKHLLHDDMRRSSTLLIFSQAINAAGAFIFWIICARLFPASQVGLATAFISYGALVAAFTHLGLPVTVLRFLPASKQRGGLFSAAITLVSICSLIGGVGAVLLVHMLAPKLGFVQHSAVLVLTLVALVVGAALSGLLDGVLTSLKKSEYVLGKALITNAPRVVLPFAIGALGVSGMVGLYTGVLILGALYSTVVIARRLFLHDSLKPRFQELRRHRSFAGANYLGSMFGILPGTLVPLIVLAKLGPSQAAFFYMPMQLAVFLGIIASSTCSALLAEVAHDDNPARYAKHVMNATKHLYRLLAPAVVVLCGVGWVILRVYGPAYAAHGYWPLVVLCAASLLVALNWLGDAWLNIQKRGTAYFLMNGVNAIAVVGAVYVFADHGLLGVAYGWLIGQAVSAAVYGTLFARNQLLTLKAKAFKYRA
jgi:O-antigen/teichoic acid export membrane protein